jgi:hypothetical protein
VLEIPNNFARFDEIAGYIKQKMNNFKIAELKYANNLINAVFNTAILCIFAEYKTALLKWKNYLKNLSKKLK